jgi:uncharacterized protein YcfJ
MKTIAGLAFASMLLAGCHTGPHHDTISGAAIGAGAGAIIGGLASGSVRGAAVGAAVGGVAGGIIGHVAGKPGYCYARNRHGKRIVVRC